MYSEIVSSIINESENLKKINIYIDNIEFENIWSSVASKSLLNKLDNALVNIISCSDELIRYANVLVEVDKYIELKNKLSDLEAKLASLSYDEEDEDAHEIKSLISQLFDSIVKLKSEIKILHSNIITSLGAFSQIAASSGSLSNVIISTNGLNIVDSSSVNDLNNSMRRATIGMSDSERREYLKHQTSSPEWNGTVLTAEIGRNDPKRSEKGLTGGPMAESESWYNMLMHGVVRIVRNDLGIDWDYWVRDDGVKMYGDYIMCAANFNYHPRGSIVETSLGTAIVCDTGQWFHEDDGTRKGIEIATTWGEVYFDDTEIGQRQKEKYLSGELSNYYMK